MNDMDELEDLRAFKLLALELANRKGFDSVIGALDSIDYRSQMKTLKSLKDQYGTCNAAGQALGVHAHQLARLISKGALYNYKGEIYIPSKTKIKLVGAVNHDL